MEIFKLIVHNISNFLTFIVEKVRERSLNICLRGIFNLGDFYE